MGKGYRAITLLFVVLILLAGIYVAGGIRIYSRYQQQILAQKQCGGEAPVVICIHTPQAIYSALYRSYVDTYSPLFMVDYRSERSMALIVKVAIPRFSSPQVRIVQAQPIFQSRSFWPPVISEYLRKLTTNSPASLSVQVTDVKRHVYFVGTFPILLYSRWLMQGMDKHYYRLAAWVTPYDSAIKDIIVKSQAYLLNQAPPVPSGMVGYKAWATPHQVIEQVNSIYDTLRLDYHLHFESLMDGNIAQQQVKLAYEVLQRHRGTGLELMTVFASAVENIGLHAVIIIAPGHAFVGVADREDNTHFAYWDVVDMNSSSAASIVNAQADILYRQYEQQHKINQAISISAARAAHINPML